MKSYNGKIVFEGYAIDEIVVYDNEVDNHKRTFTTQQQEFTRFDVARKKAVVSFTELFIEATEKLGGKQADLFKTHRLMAEDLDFEDLVRANIAKEQVAEDAVMNAAEELSKMFLSLDDAYMKARAADVKEVGQAIVNILLGVDKLPKITKPSILVCNDLPASALMKFSRKLLNGVVLLKGNVNSHVAIFARTLEIPTIAAIEGLELDSSLNGKLAVVDATKGTLILEPDKKTIDKYDDLNDQYIQELLALKSFIGKPSVTKDGFKLKVYANIASAYEVANVLKKDAEGVGLFRSEFIYLQSNDYPTEEMQCNYYKEVLEEMKGKEVVIRTFDIGADKKVFYFNLPYEENPALGFRSIRICRKRPDVLLTQLRALYRASMSGKLSIMVPMIVSEEEIIFVKKLCNQVKAEFNKEGVPFDKDVKLGVMIETPAAALISDRLAKHVDFFSIGTNDLSQYTLACDRLNSNLDDTFDPYHSAILKLIKLTIENAHKAGIPCGMCGELARDPHIIPFLAGLHIDEISCSSAYVLKVRKALSEIDTKKVNIDKYIK